MERGCEERLAKSGFDCYLPMFTMESDRRPVFPSYMFVQFDIDDDRWARINEDRGVVKLLPLHRPYPVPISARLIEQCRKREDDGEFIVRTGRLSLKYRPGDTVMVERGSFATKQGKFVRQERGMAVLLMSIFNALREISVPQEHVAQ